MHKMIKSINKNFIIIIAISLFFGKCIQVPKQFDGLTPGIWRGVFILKDQRQPIVTKGKNKIVTLDVTTDKQYFTSPFNFTISRNESKELIMTVTNAEEKIVFSPIQYGRDRKTGEDTFYVELNPYDAVLKGIYDENQMKGNFIVRDKPNYYIPFEAKFGQNFRFEKIPKKANIDLTGTWQVTFGKNTTDEFNAIGEFQQTNNHLNGTFRTETGDFRYLEGLVEENIVKLSCFDGAHVFLYDAFIQNDSLQGIFYSGTHYQVPFVGFRTDSPKLIHGDSLVKILSNKPFIFSLEDTNGKMISNADPEYANKLKLIQITGSWCPNCRDEGEFLNSYLKENPNSNIAIFSLAFERYPDRQKALERVKKYKQAMNTSYPMLYAGLSNRDSASLLIPQIDGIRAYPTLLFLDKNNSIVKVHSGFDGPATSKFTEFKNEFETTIKELNK